jgi:hypothetical protein
MLSSARKHIVSEVNSSPAGMDSFAAYQILSEALMNVTRALEAL